LTFVANSGKIFAKGGKMKYKTKKLILTDAETGERFPFLVIPLTKSIGGRWMRLFQDTLLDLIQRKRLGGEALRVKDYLLAVSNWQNQVPGTAKTAEVLGIRQAHASRAYSELVKAGYLVKKEETYYVNPLLCWKGNDKQLEQAIGELLATPVKALREGTE